MYFIYQNHFKYISVQKRDITRINNANIFFSDDNFIYR